MSISWWIEITVWGLIAIIGIIVIAHDFYENWIK